MPNTTETTPSPALSGRLFILVGPSGVGKNTLMLHALAGGLVRQFPTATTRPMRPTEAQGREHYFVSDADFQTMIDTDDLLEYQFVHRKYFYGVPRSLLASALASGQHLIADIEVLGARQVRAAFPDNTTTIFIQPPSAASLIERLRARGERDAVIARRLLRTPMEMSFAGECDHRIDNHDFDRACQHLEALIEAILRHQPPPVNDPPVPALPRFEIAAHFGTLRIATPIREDEAPQVTAERLLRDQLGGTLPFGNWESGSNDNDIVAPSGFAVGTDPDGREVVTYRYVWRPIAHDAMQLNRQSEDTDDGA